MRNIDLFDTYTAKIFAQLYEAFPMPCHLDAQKISECPGIDDFGVMRPQAEVCLATMRWLQDAGYIQCDEVTQYALIGSVLTAKGLEMLKAMPDSINGKTPMGEQIAKLVKTGSMDLAREVTKAAVSYGIKFVMGG